MGGKILERYDNIEYSFENNSPIPQNDSVATTDKDGFITSQQYIYPQQQTDNSEEFVPDEELPKKPERDRNSPRETVLVFQLTVCILLAIAAYVIQSIGGELYENVREFYYSNLNNSIIININNDNNSDFVKDAIDELNGK